MYRGLFGFCLFCIALLLLVPALAAAQSNLFTTISLSPVASLPLAVASGDFNGDGIPDQAVTSSGTNAVSILLGTGDGNFLPAVNYPVGADPVAIVTGDFNHDGHLDLAVLNSNPNTGGAGGSVSILNGQSGGTFVAGPTYAVGLIPTAIGVGDFDGDGNLDLAVVISNPSLLNTGFVTILMGSANGSFTAQANYGVGMLPVSIAVGDFTGDGKLDLAVGSTAISFTNPQSEISILTNNGSGGFQAGPSFVTGPTGTVPISITVADFNDDARLDLAVALDNTTNVLICQGNGDGTFSIVNAPGVGSSPLWISAGDFNGDGKPDLMVANNPDDTVSVLLGNGDETFSNGAVYPVGTHPTNLVLADLNGDGKLDVAVVNNGDNNTQVFLGEGNGTFRSGSYRVGANPTGITSADFNNDGFPDLAVLNGDATLTILLGDGHGGFRMLSPIPGCQGLSGSSPGQIASADLNHDGKFDLAAVCNNPNNPTFAFINLFYGKGDGTFPNTGAAFVGNGVAALTITGLTITDLDHDGLPEVVYSSYGTYSLSGAVGFFTYLKDSGFAYQSPDAIEGVAAGDFNGDGNADVFANGPGIVLLGDGAGNFQPNSLGLDASVVGDFNGDGLTDIIGSVSSVTVTALSNGDGSFRAGFQFASPFTGLSVADFNGDGIPDILSFSQHPVYLGQIDGSFIDSEVSPLPFSNAVPVVADFDGNGSPDVAVLDFGAGTVSILLNKNSFQLTSTVLSEAPAHVVAGQPLNLSAAVGSKQGTPTGSLVFKQAGIVQTTQALNAGAAQTTLAAPSALGQYGYTALYTGDGTYSGSLSQRLVVTVSPASTTTIVTSSDPTSKLGQSVTFTATIAPQFSGEPSGTVKFFADGAPLVTSNVNGGQATISTAALSMGKHTIEADYSGDASFITSLGLMKQNVGKAVSTVALMSSLNPAAYGQPVTVTATVTNSDGTTPTGPIVFAEGSTVYGTVSLSGGAAQITLPTLIVGKHKITAQYGGDTTDAADNATLTETITGGPSTTTVTSSAQPSTYGQSVTFTAVVSGGGATPDGTVTFKNGGAVLGTVALAGGQAVFAVNTLTGGSHTINAVYNGNSMYTSSTGSVPQIVEPVATSTSLTSSLNPAPSGQTVTLTAVVTSPAAALPTGKLTIKDGKTVLISTTLVNGQAQISTSLLTNGAHNITATFAGSASYAGSQTALSQLIQ